MNVEKKALAGVLGSLTSLRTENFKDKHISISLNKQVIIRGYAEGVNYV